MVWYSIASHEKMLAAIRLVMKIDCQTAKFNHTPLPNIMIKLLFFQYYILTGSTSPLRVTSPVIAVSERTQRPLKREVSTVTMVMPAKGQSLPTAPAGK